jgi:LPS sulfotransferase NodH
MKNKNFIIFAHARSGSISLKKALEAHPEINILGEPFNKDYFLRKYKESPREINNLLIRFKNGGELKSFNEVLDAIKKNYQGFKHLWGAFNKTHNEHLLSKKNPKIIFLSRNNLLKSRISFRIALTTQIWTTKNKLPVNECKKITLNYKFEPIIVNELKKGLQELNDSKKYYKQFLTKNKIPFFEITYEELYGPKISIDKKVKKIQEIFEFLGYERINDPKILEKIKGILDYKKRKMNDFETYMKIPNILEIEDKLGNKETGYLFNSQAKLKISKIKLNKIKNKLNNNEK